MRLVSRCLLFAVLCVFFLALSQKAGVIPTVGDELPPPSPSELPEHVSTTPFRTNRPATATTTPTPPPLIATTKHSYTATTTTTTSRNNNNKKKERCPQSSGRINGLPIGNLLSEPNPHQIQRCATFPHALQRPCLGIRNYTDKSDGKKWEHRMVAHQDPVFAPMHGGVTTVRLFRVMHQLAAHCIVPLDRPEQWPNRTVIVELGAGSAGPLSIVTPPLPHVYGVGSDIGKPLVDLANEFYPHLYVEHAVGLPDVPSGVASCIYSIGVFLALDFAPVCSYIAEGLRVMKPGGVFLILGAPSKDAHRGHWNSYHPWFFQNGTGNYLPSCTNLGRLVESVEIISSRWFAVYSRPFLTVKITRNHEPLHCFATDEEQAAGGDDKKMQAIKDRFFDRMDRLRESRRRNASGGLLAVPMPNMTWFYERQRKYLHGR